MTPEKVTLPHREDYSVKDLILDLKKIDATPSITYEVGKQIVFAEMNCCERDLGEDHPISEGLRELLQFMQVDYERMLLVGELRTASHTPQAAFNAFVKRLPKEVMEHRINRESEYIHSVLETAIELRRREVETCSRYEAGVRKEIEDNPDDTDLQNKLRLILWLLGRYKEASTTFRTAKRLGWTPERNDIAGI